MAVYYAIKLKFPASCDVCGKYLRPGDDAYYRNGDSRCPRCYDAHQEHLEQRRENRKPRRRRGRRKGVTNVTTAHLSPEQIAERRADTPNQNYRPAWISAPTKKQLAAEHRQREQAEQEAIQAAMSEPMDDTVGGIEVAA
jgi:hypothetical protein